MNSEEKEAETRFSAYVDALVGVIGPRRPGEAAH